jgi:hypothetical protein
MAGVGAYKQQYRGSRESGLLEPVAQDGQSKVALISKKGEAMLRRTLFATVCALTLTAAAQAAWTPTGKTKFDVPLTVVGSRGQTVQISARLYYEMATGSGSHRQTKWEPLAGASVSFQSGVLFGGVVGPIIPRATTGPEGWAKYKGPGSQIGPNCGPSAFWYVAHFDGGMVVQGVRLSGCASAKGYVIVKP